MSGDILSFITEKILLIIVLIVIIISLIVLKIIEKRTGRRRSIIQAGRFSYKERLNSIKKSGENAEKTLEKVNALSRQFFEEVFGAGKEEDFAQVRGSLKNKKAHEFCGMLVEINYSGRKIDKREIDFLIRKFEEVLEEKEISVKSRMIAEEKAKKPIDFPSLKE